jgi:uncharacterized protein (TIGR02996 family)
MTRYAELHDQITTNPEDDAARLALADFIRDSEPDRAKFIEDQIATAQQRRQKRGRVDTNVYPLLRRHQDEWTRMVAKFASRIIFDRGFVTSFRIDPYLFLEYGEWLYKNAPIRMVEFAKPEEGPFPTQELAESPLLARLDAIGIMDGSLLQTDIEQLAASPHLGRLLHFSSVNLGIQPDVYERIAAFPLMRKAMRVLFTEKGFPGQRYEESDIQDMEGRWRPAWTDLAPEGKALEKQYGYIPWLHPEKNRAEPFDSGWYVAQGILPVKPVGSPVI